MTEREIIALCGVYHREPKFADENGEEYDNPETEKEFAERMVAEFIAGKVESYESDLVRKKAEEDYKNDPIATVDSAKLTEEIK